MKHIKILFVLLLLGFVFASCEKEQKNEWNKHYGYTKGEIVGPYSYSNVANAFDGLNNNIYCHICEDAIICIFADSGDKIRFDFKSAKAELNVSLTGPIVLNENDFLINYADGLFHLTAYVYTNAAGQIRLHGFVRRDAGDRDTYYFDVIKN